MLNNQQRNCVETKKCVPFNASIKQDMEQEIL